MSIIILLNQVEDAKSFVADMRKLPCDVDLIRGHYVIDAKSILGIFSISLAEPIVARILTDDEEVIKQFEDLCTKYCVRED